MIQELTQLIGKAVCDFRIQGRQIFGLTDVARKIEQFCWSTIVIVDQFPVAAANATGGSYSRAFGPPVVGKVPMQRALGYRAVTVTSQNIGKADSIDHATDLFGILDSRNLKDR